MSENIGNLYVRTDSEEEVNNSGNETPKKSSTFSSLRNLRDTFKRSETRTSQSSLSSKSIHNEPINSTFDNNAPAIKSGKCFILLLMQFNILCPE